jgi:hypothetical protein
MQHLVGLFGFLGLMITAQASTLADCDLLYSHRGSDALKSADCYQELVTGSEAGSEDQKKIFVRSFVALSSVVNDYPKTKIEREAIDKGLALVKELSKNFPDSADLPYWRACMVSFDVFQKDRGAAIPTHTFRAIGAIQSDLRLAIQKDSSIHFFGPPRVLGIMHTQMPAIAGGDKTLAEKLLKEAHTKAPGFSMNHLSYARILDVNGKNDDAIKVLQKMIETPDNFFNPYLNEPLLSLQLEITKDKKAAAELLKDISE